MVVGDKKGVVVWLKIVGGGVGSAGFFVVALGNSTYSALIGVTLVGIGSLLLTAGGLV